MTVPRKNPEIVNLMDGRADVPEWAREFDANSWAQFFLKYVGSHPAVTAITPATSKPSNMADNMGAAVGRLPDAAMRNRMIQFMEELP